MASKVTRILAGLTLSVLLCPPVGARQALATPLTGEERAELDATLRRGEAYFHVMQAQLAARQGFFLEVLRELREAAALEPDSADLHAEAGALLLQLGQRTEAEGMAKRALEIDPEARVAIRVLADLAASRAARSPGDLSAWHRAIRLYEKLAGFSDVDEEVLLILAQLKLRTGEEAEAIELASRLVARRPGDTVPVRLLAQALIRDQQSSRALSALLEHLVKNPGADEISLTVEELAFQTEEWETVEKAFARIVKARPDLVSARRIWGEALLNLDRPQEAVPQLERAVHLDPEDPSARLHLAHAYWQARRLADAVDLSEKLIEEYPGAVQACWVLGMSLAEQGDLEGALKVLSSALEILDGAPSEEAKQRDQFRLRIARLLLNHGRSKDALRTLSDLEVSGLGESSELEARAHIHAGDPKRARSLARRLRSTRADGTAALLEGELFLDEGQVVKATARFREAIQVLGSPARFRVDRVLQDGGHKEEAERFLRKWVQAEPGEVDARFALGSFLERESRYDEAEAELRKVLELDPRHAWALNHMGYSLADRNLRLEEALELIRRALELDPWNGAYLDSLGWVYFRMGRYEDAREPLERAAREYPRDPTVLEHLGDVYQSLGDREAAVRAWREALAFDPEDPESLHLKLQARGPEAEGQDEADTVRKRLR